MNKKTTIIRFSALQVTTAYTDDDKIQWRGAATANCRTEEEEKLTTGWWNDLVQQLRVRSLPDFLYHRS